MADHMEMEAAALKELYKWIDSIPLSRPKKNISRDFSDGVLMSEVCNHFVPNLVDLHNYSSTNSVSQKNYNWTTLNQKVFRRLGFTLSEGDIKAITACTRGAIERALVLTRDKIVAYQDRQRGGGAAAPTSPPTNRADRGRSPRNRRSRSQEGKRKKGDRRQGNKSFPDVNGGRGGRDRKQKDRDSNHLPTVSPANSRGSGGGREKKGGRRGDRGGGEQSAERYEIIIQQKDTIIHDLRDTVDILQAKVQKLQQLVQLKNERIKSLNHKLEQFQNDY